SVLVPGFGASCCAARNGSAELVAVCARSASNPLVSVHRSRSPFLVPSRFFHQRFVEGPALGLGLEFDFSFAPMVRELARLRALSIDCRLYFARPIGACRGGSTCLPWGLILDRVEPLVPGKFPCQHHSHAARCNGDHSESQSGH